MDRAMLDKVLKGATTKSEKIRRLHEIGMKPAEIADHLGIIYQFAYNVIAAAEAKKASVEVSEDGEFSGLTIDQAKRGLALRFGVPLDAIEIVIRA